MRPQICAIVTTDDRDDIGAFDEQRTEASLYEHELFVEIGANVSLSFKELNT
jgi:hypothetical protein